MMHEMGLDAYRFSIAWPRLIPDGRGAVNPLGLEYYNNLINELLSYGIQPHVTIYHNDLPQALEDEYLGILSPRFIEDFSAYADVCFKEFGDRVKHWVTVNEPNMEPIGGYDLGYLPPQRCSYPFGENCTAGNSTTEPYLVAHHLLLAHAAAVALYKEKYQAIQGGEIGMTILCSWYEPTTQSPEDIAAAETMREFHIGWLLHPLVYGDYPAVMRENAGSRLPTLSVEESNRVKGSFDFVGLNHYVVIGVHADPDKLNQQVRDYNYDAGVTSDTHFPIPGRVLSQANNLCVLQPAAWGLAKMMDYVRDNYENPPIIIHENGVGGPPDPTGSYTVDDDYRSEFLQEYIEMLYLLVRNGSNVDGYFVWSFLDSYELLFGYTKNYGLYGVDFSVDERKRYARNSARWYSSFLKGGELRPESSAGKAYVA